MTEPELEAAIEACLATPNEAITIHGIKVTRLAYSQWLAKYAESLGRKELADKVRRRSIDCTKVQVFKAWIERDQRVAFKCRGDS